MENYIRYINPKDDPTLIPGASYKIWRNGKYLGIATWTLDENVGNSFQTQSVHEKHGLLIEVWIADKWELA